MTAWTEVGERVFARRYEFFDQNVGVVLGEEGVLVVDTRTSLRQAAEVVEHLRELTSRPVSVVVNTHAHSDHCFGNGCFRPAPVWGHVRCVTMLRDTGPRQLEGLIANIPDMADEFAEVTIDTPDRTLTDSATVELDPDGRSVELRYLGRGHTDNDVVVVVPDAKVVFAGDLLENGATPSFADGFPLDWPMTVERLVDLIDGPVVPGHGDIGDKAWAIQQMREFRDIAELARLVHAGTLALEQAVVRTPYRADDAREPLERALRQLRGELKGFDPPDPE